MVPFIIAKDARERPATSAYTFTQRIISEDRMLNVYHFRVWHLAVAATLFAAEAWFIAETFGVIH